MSASRKTLLSHTLSKQETPLRRPQTPSSASRPTRVIEENGYHTVTRICTFPKPVMEGMMGSQEVSGRLDKGFALVLTRNPSSLYLFHYMSTSLKSDYYHLMLPESAVLNPNLISVVDKGSTKYVLDKGAMRGATLLVCIAEGNLRYWPNIDLPNYIDGVLPLEKNEYCTHTSSLKTKSFIVATSLARLFVITPEGSVIHRRIVQQSQGWMSGFGRILKFNSMDVGKDKDTRALLVGDQWNDTSDVFIMFDEKIQRWGISNDRDILLFDWPLVQAVFRSLQSPEIVAKEGKIEMVRLLDLGMASSSILYVLASLKFDRSNLIYTIYELDVSSSQNGIARDPVLNNYSILPSFSFGEFTMATNTRLVLQGGGPAAYVVWPQLKIVLSTKVPHDERPADWFHPNDTILGYGGNDKGILLMIPRYGIVECSQEEKYIPAEPETPKRSEIVPKQSTSVGGPRILVQDQNELLKEKFQILEAFRYFRSSHEVRSDYTLQQMVLPLHNMDCNEVVRDISEWLVNAQPISDPRWAEEGSSVTTTFLFVQHQIVEKQKKMIAFGNFLSVAKFLQRLSLETRTVIAEHSQKLASAVRLAQLMQNLQQKVSMQLVNEAISRVLKETKNMINKGLNPQDLFFSNVTGIADICDQLIWLEQDYMSKHRSSTLELQNTFKVIDTSNQILEAILDGSRLYRETNLKFFFPELTYPAFPLPWTTSPYMRSVVQRQCEITIRFLEESGQSGPQKRNVEAKEGQKLDLDYDLLFLEIFNLSQLVLAGYQMELDMLSGDSSREMDYQALHKKYNEISSSAIQPFMEGKRYEQARELAERYEEFNTLIYICEELNDKDRLAGYMERFSKKGFAQFLFQWYYNNERVSRLLEQPQEYWVDLRNFLTPYPHLSWLHDIKMSDFGRCSVTTSELGQLETESLERKKILLSISQLAGLASERVKDPKEMLPEEQLLSLIRHQEILHNYVPIDNINIHKPLSPIQLIDAVTGPYRPGVPTREDFVYAFNVFVHSSTQLKSQEESIQILEEIWKRCINIGVGEKKSWANLAEEWNSQIHSAKDFDHILRNSLFYQVASTAEGQALLPPVIRRLIAPYNSDDKKIQGRLIFTVYQLAFPEEVRTDQDQPREWEEKKMRT